MLTRAEMVERLHRARMGLAVTPEQWRFYEVFGLFRLGVIAQQIYYRYHHGQTTNEAYARFLPMVQLPRAALQPADRRGRCMSRAAAGPARPGVLGRRRLRPALRRSARSSPGCSGAALAARGVRPDRGGARRRCAGTGRPPTARSRRPAGTADVVEDAGWDEFDHLQHADRRRRSSERSRASRTTTGSRRFEATIDRWAVGEHDDEYRRELPGLPGSGSRGALQRAVRAARARSRPRWCSPPAARCPGSPRRCSTAACRRGRRLARVVVNSSVTKVLVGRRGTTLISFNDHSHLEDGDPGLLTYR